MAFIHSTFWQKNKYKLSGFILLLPLLFLYQSLTPTFPPAWQAQELGEFKIAPLPLDLKDPYVHHDDYVKDFMLVFEKGEVGNIRQGYANIGTQALPIVDLQRSENGILHGNKHGQHVHAIATKTLTSADSLWISIENWQGEWQVAKWPLPAELIVQTH
ncbi:hypothetical protein HGO26_18830 [Shewanella sp. S-1]|uniref:Uncharacterized protein n=1 Tax=Shewanella oncorhynchi TaxID=2726434 RepID=A0ABX1KU35_9GAMM|nr:hypothetical protein [Shewanella oncorhynchi]NLQ24924.1 hypothetical protein [Shewanella oncorhynchi]